MDKKKIENCINILKKYINDDELKFIVDGFNTFNTYENFLIEYSIKYVYKENQHKTEKRILFGLNYKESDRDKYFKFMNIEPFDIKDLKNAIYFGYDKTNNLKKLYFEKLGVGGLCYEYKNNTFDNLKKYYLLKNISDEIFNYIPESITKIIRNNCINILYFKNKNMHVYQFQINYKLDYNEDFYCSVICIAFDNDYNIKYHTFYLRFKDKTLFLI
jgi:hypothetical protein